jgi:hypothetical protein
MLVFGLTVWPKTTEVYRVSLPYDGIAALSDMKAKLAVNVQLVTVDTHKEHQLGPKIQQVLTKASKESSVYSFSMSARAPTQEENRVVRESKDYRELDDRLRAAHANVMPGFVFLFEVPRGQFADPIVLGRHR